MEERIVERMHDRKGMQSIICHVDTCMHYDFEHPNGCKLESIEIMPMRNQIDMEEESMCHSFERYYEPNYY